MRQTVLKEAVELKLPAQQNMMLVLRLTTAGVVARMGLTVDRLDDVKMAVEEACSCLINAENPPERLWLRFMEEEGTLVIRICSDCECSGSPIGEDEACVVRCILEALVDGVNIRMNGENISGLELRVALNQ